MSRSKGAFLTALFMALFLAVLIFIAQTRPGSLDIMARCFAVLGLWHFGQLLFLWIVSDGRKERR